MAASPAFASDELLVRAATPDDFAALGCVLWDAFGPKLGFFLGDDGARGARLLADLFSGGALRPASVRVAATTAAKEPLGLCLLRLPGAPRAGGSALAATFAQARREFGFWCGLRAFAGLSLFHEQKSRRRDTAIVALLAVAPPARGRGVGGALLRAAEEEARRNGVRRLVLDVIESNPARRLYERHGFHVTKTHRVRAPLSRMVGFHAYDHMEKGL